MVGRECGELVGLCLCVLSGGCWFMVVGVGVWLCICLGLGCLE